MRAELIYNPYAGPFYVRRELEFVMSFLERHGWTLAIRETKAPHEAIGLAREAALRGVDFVVAVGGDGTVNEVARGLVHTDAALGVLPVGTTNVWTHQTRIPTPNPMRWDLSLARLVGDLEERRGGLLSLRYYRSVLLDAAKVLLTGKIVTVDMGQADGRYFLLWAGIGLDAAVTLSVPSELKKAFGPLAFVGTTLDTLRDYRSADVRIVLDGQARRVNTSLIVVSNIQLYGGILPLGARACVDDGKLDVCIFRGEGILSFVQHAVKVASRQHLKDPKIEYYQARDVLIESATPFPVHADNEPFTETPVRIRIVPQSLKVIVPLDVPEELFVGPSQAAAQE